MSKNRQPISANDQATLDSLKTLGIEFDESGKPVPVEGGAFQGELFPAKPEPGIVSSPEVVTIQPSQSPTPLMEETEEVPPVQEAAEPTQEAPEPLKGEAKREHDARQAQRELSKTQLKLDKTVAEITRRQSELDEQLRKLTALQSTTGFYPENLNPADAATVAQYREEYGEAVGVMEAIVAPVYQVLSQLREQINGVVKQQGEYFGKLKEDEVLGAVYSKIPKERVQQISESNDFIAWLSSKPNSKRTLYVDVLNNTTKYSSEDALDIFAEYAKDTGTDIMNGSKPKPQIPAMDSAPMLKKGSDFPSVAPVQQQPANDVNRPLSVSEFNNFSALLEGARTNEQKDILIKRLNLTSIDPRKVQFAKLM